MSEMLHSLSAVLLVLMIISVGYAFGRFGWMRKEHKKFVIKLIINVGMPALCAYNIFTQFSSEMLSDAGYLVLLPILSMTATLILGVLLSKLLRIERIRGAVYRDVRVFKLNLRRTADVQRIIWRGCGAICMIFLPRQHIAVLDDRQFVDSALG